MKIATGVYDPDDLVDRIMKLPIREVVKIERMLMRPIPDWSFLKELADEIKDLEDDQRVILSKALTQRIYHS